MLGRCGDSGMRFFVLYGDCNRGLDGLVGGVTHPASSVVGLDEEVEDLILKSVTAHFRWFGDWEEQLL